VSPFEKLQQSLTSELDALNDRARAIKAHDMEEVLSNIYSKDGALLWLVTIHNQGPPLPIPTMLSGDRADHPISSEACPEAQADRRNVGGLGHFDPKGLQGSEVRYVDLPLQVPPYRTGPTRTAHQGDLRDTRAVWLPPRSCAFAPRWLEDQYEEDTQDLQRVRASTA